MAEYLGKIREWIQRNAINGSSVTWGSNDILRFTKSLTVKDFEDLAKEIAGEETNQIVEILSGKAYTVDKIRFGNYTYNVWESDKLWMAKMVDSNSPFWDYQEVSKESLFIKMKGCHDFPLVIVEDKPTTRPVNEITERLNDKVKKADKIRGFLKGSGDGYSTEDLKEELEIVKQDIRTLKWVLEA